MFITSKAKGTTFNVEVVASGIYGIARINVNATFNGSASDFKDDIMRHVLMAGYQSILHYKKVNGNDVEFMFQTNSDSIYDKVLSVCESMVFFYKGRDAILEYENTDGGVEGVSVYNGEPHYKYGWDKRGLMEKLDEYTCFLDGMKYALECLGVDVNDNASKQAILKNLGFFNVEKK